MAGVSTKEIKNRIRSMESTKQITKAMEMVAASKLRRAQAQVLNSRPYFHILSSTIDNIVEQSRGYHCALYAYLRQYHSYRNGVVEVGLSRFSELTVVHFCGKFRRIPQFIGVVAYFAFLRRSKKFIDECFVHSCLSLFRS